MTSDHLSGHAIARRQIEKHGQDRYPTIGGQYSKILEEMGELGDALWVDARQGDYEGDIGPEVRRELADVGLALFELCNKLGVTDLIGEMRDLVDRDQRKFADEQRARHEESHRDGEIYSAEARGEPDPRLNGPCAATQAYGATGCT